MTQTIATDRFYLAAFLMERGIELKEHSGQTTDPLFSLKMMKCTT